MASRSAAILIERHEQDWRRPRRYRQWSGTSISEGPSRSSASRTACIELVGIGRAAAGDAVCMRKRKEVGIVELDVEIAPVVIAVLDVLDRAICRIVVHQRDHAQAVPRRGGELLSRHQKAAIAADDDNRPAAAGDSRAHACGKCPAERDKV